MVTESAASTVAVIPARDEEASVGMVVAALLKKGVRSVRVVDNGSSDRTAVVACNAGAEVCQEPVRGYGRACWRGLQDLPGWAEWILFCDADGSDDLDELPAFFHAAREADFILGARRTLRDGPSVLTPVQRFGNALSTTLIRIGWGYLYQDLGPLRLIRRRALDDIRMRDRSWGWTLEMQVRAIENRLRIIELPVTARPRLAGKSKISGSVIGTCRASFGILSMLLRLYVRRKT